MRVYISGPITGHPDYKATFTAAADRLTANGFEAVNPATIPERDDWTWDDYMRAAVAMQATCSGIYMLPGWQKSRGAVIERWIAYALEQRVWGAAA